MIRLVLLLSLTSCYGRKDAADDVVKAGGEAPVHCVAASGGLNTGGEYQERTFICVDRIGSVFFCSEADGCVMTKGPR